MRGRDCLPEAMTMAKARGLGVVVIGSDGGDVVYV